MDTQQASTHEATEGSVSAHTESECGIDALAKKVAQSAQALGAHCEALRRKFDQVDTPLHEKAKGLADAVSEQARAHPLATFGIAFAAGALLARALRR